MKRLVVLGGGYGGTKVVAGLLNHQLSEDIDITVVDRDPYQSLKTEFYSIAAGTAADKDMRVAFPDDKRVRYVFGEVIKINTDNQEIILEGKSTHVPYDYLVVALGCEDNYHGIEGAEEYTESVQTFQKVRKTSTAVGNLPAYGKVAIVGAGLSGIEVAAEIRESRPDLNIRLLDRGSSVLKAFNPKIREYVESWFVENQVEVLHHANVEYVEKSGVCNDGICYIDDVTIWTAGVQPHYLARSLPFEKDQQDKIIVNDFYQVPENPSVYVVGDCASSVHSPSGQLAMQQGEQIADILLDVLHDKQPKKPREVKLKGTLGSLGKSDGFGNMFQQPFTGLVPRIAKSGVLWLSKRH